MSYAHIGAMPNAKHTTTAANISTMSVATIFAMHFQRAIQMEAALFAPLYAAQDTKEAYAAFLEKRPHRPYTGR